MSGIWGIINLNGDFINCKQKDKMKKPYQSCKIDKYFELLDENVYLECGMQYFTQESKYETLPFHDKEKMQYYNGDVYLDNRNELLEELQIPKEDWGMIADGTLWKMAYQKWKKKCVNHIRGSYVLMVYDKEKQEIICIRDATGNRCIYYTFEDGQFYFSSLLKSIIYARKKKTEINQRWICDFLALDQLAMTTECRETPYEGIYKLEPAQIVTITLKDGVVGKDYWNPLSHLSTLKLKSDEEYGGRFLELFQDAVNCNLRARGEIGILLSGGLDSTATAAISAPILKKQKKKLQSFTSIPEDGYELEQKRYYIENESSNVQILETYLENLQCNFLDMEGQNCWDDKAEMLEIYEMPYKALQNVSWINESAKKAREKGCSIMLTGQFGNSTISFGYEEVHYQTLLKSGRLLKLKYEIDRLHKRIPLISRKKVWQDVLKELIPYKIRLSFLKEKDMFENVLISGEKIKKYQIEKRFQKRGLNMPIKKQYTWKQFKTFIIMKEAMSQIGEMETKVSLKHGILIKDPSRDKRVIEFCLSLPSDQFVRDGISRRLIRIYMKEQLPEEILNELYKRGKQSADWMYRLQKRWAVIYADMKEVFNKEKVKEYFDEEKVNRVLEHCKYGPTKEETQMRTLFYSAILAEFIKKEEIL